MSLDKLFFDTVDGITRNAGTFEQQVSAKFEQTRVKNVINDIMTSNYLPTRSSSTYIRYVCFARLIEKILEMGTLLEKLHKDCKEKKELVIFRLDGDVLYYAEKEYITMMIENEIFLIKKPTKSTSFPSPNFYLHCKTRLTEFNLLFK